MDTYGKQKDNSKKQKDASGEKGNSSNKRAILVIKGHFWGVIGHIDLRTKALATSPPLPPSEVVIFGCFKPK